MYIRSIPVGVLLTKINSEYNLLLAFPTNEKHTLISIMFLCSVVEMGIYLRYKSRSGSWGNCEGLIKFVSDSARTNPPSPPKLGKLSLINRHTHNFLTYTLYSYKQDKNVLW